MLDGYQEQEGVKKAFTALGNNAKIQNELLAIIMKYEETTLDKVLISADLVLKLKRLLNSNQDQQKLKLCPKLFLHIS